MRILLIEDEERLAATIGQALRELGIAVDLAADGAVGSLMAEQDIFDAVILDLMLPEKSGQEVLRDLRKRKLHTPVLVLTAREEKQAVVELLNLGADDYLAKPFDLSELIARIRALVRRSSGTATPLIHIGPIEIDTVQQTVALDKSPIDLSPKEYRILEYLAQRPGAVVSKQELLESLYDMEWEHHSNVIEAHVSNLRKKLAQHGTNSLIETLRHRGYRLMRHQTGRPLNLNDE